MDPRRTILLAKALIWAVGLGPIIWLVWAFFQGDLGANPIEEVILIGGRWTLVFLLAAMAVTPIRRLTGWNRVIQLRRLVGAYALGLGVNNTAAHRNDACSWQPFFLRLPDAVQDESIQIEFLFDTGPIPRIDPEGWYVDDIEIINIPPLAIFGYKWPFRIFFF